jgi:hypothetical protein
MAVDYSVPSSLLVEFFAPGGVPRKVKLFAVGEDLRPW